LAAAIELSMKNVAGAFARVKASMICTVLELLGPSSKVRATHFDTEQSTRRPGTVPPVTEVTGTGASALAVLCFGRGVAVVAAGTGFFVAVEGVGTTLGVVLGGSLGDGVLSGDGVVAEGDGTAADGDGLTGDDAIEGVASVTGPRVATVWVAQALRPSPSTMVAAHSRRRTFSTSSSS